MVTALVMSLVLAADPEAVAEKRQGAVVAPAALPPGTLALYGLMGAPDLGAGYRQGIGGVELEAKALFNIFEVSGLFEGGVKVPIFRGERLALAPGVAMGLKLNSGSRYFDAANFGYLGLRPKVSFHATYTFSDLMEGVAQLEVPLTIPLTAQGIQFTPLLGAGVEFQVGGSFSVSGTVHVGLDVVKEPLGVPQTRAAWGVRLGVGYRLF
ncbi:MAG: hypothetical protein IT380_15255 [Myxococcales bacterium]|nr:hypothetical protein [Myxococcales bacterium]